MTPVHPLDEAATARAVIDADGTLLQWSEGARRLPGHAPEEVEGRPASGLLADRADLPGEPTGIRWNCTVALRHRDGHTLPVWLPAHRRQSPDGDPSVGWWSHRWNPGTPPAGRSANVSASWMSRSPRCRCSPRAPWRSTTSGCACSP
ncbi:hypothetical protein [Streptomyces sp. NPDC088358]|uniref:hypothetical protein n=1 Tax=Streptomyces sp. NPDC088358 TaxID=3365857 RepID=UPI0037FB50F6